MLDARLIGSYISGLRKQADLTQVEMADRLDVSHQAVSKWERGESLPDIGTLLALAELFQTSVDTILNGGSGKNFQGMEPLMKDIVDHQPKEAAQLLKEGKVKVDHLIDIAPLTKTSTLREITENLSNPHFSLNQLISLAPFLDQDALETLLHRSDMGTMEINALTALAPFISSETLANLLNDVDEATLDIKHMIALAPFLDDAFDPLLNKIEIGSITWKELARLAPFIESETMGNVIAHHIEEPPTLSVLLHLAPFLEEQLDTLIEQIETDAITWMDLMHLAPFLNEDSLEHLTKKLNEQNPVSTEAITKLAPFIKRTTLQYLILSLEPAALHPDLIADLAPFIDKQTLSQLVNKLTKQ